MSHPPNQTTQHKTNWLNLVLLTFVLFSLGVALYLGWSSYQLDQSQAQLKKAIAGQKQTLVELKQQEQVGERMQAADILKQAQNYRQNWSEIVTKLNQTFTQRGQMKINSVKVSRDGTIALQAQAPDILSVASFLVVVERSDDFSNGFISRIAPPQTADSQSAYHFDATLNYVANPEL